MNICSRYKRRETFVRWASKLFEAEVTSNLQVKLPCSPRPRRFRP